MMKFEYKKRLKDLNRLRVGTYREGASGLYLDRNERTVPFDEATRRQIAEVVAKASLNLYPDIPAFYRKLSKWLGVAESQLFITEGVSGAVKSLVETIAEPGDNIIFPTPTFAMYPVYCRMFDVEPRTFGYRADYSFDLDAMYGLIDKRTSTLFLPNPNVPIEGTLDIDKVAAIAERCRKEGVFLVMDEVYYPFGGPTASDLIDRYDNLLVMRSFSKAFGLAGIRLGYIIGSAEMMDYVSKIRTGYESNTASIAIASLFMDNYNLVESYIGDIKNGLSFLKRELKKMGFDHNGGNASNFLFIRLGSPDIARSVAAALAKRRIFIRAGWPEPFSDGISVTAAPADVMRTFVKELSQAISSAKVES